MTAESIVHEIKLALNGRPGQALVLGICRALAARLKQEVWLVRLVTIVLGMLWTLPVLAAYIVLGFTLHETEQRTRGFFTGLGILARETAAKWFAALGGLFGSSATAGRRNRSF